MSDEVYLRTRYEDPRRGEIREREYTDDGTVWVTVNGERSVWCRFGPASVQAARTAVLEAQLGALDDIDDTDDTNDTDADLATMTYEWSVEDNTGRFVDAAYPAVVPEAVDRLEESLLRLEEDAAASGG